MEEECPRPRVDDGRPLVADDRLGETDVVEVALTDRNIRPVATRTGTPSDCERAIAARVRSWTTPSDAINVPSRSLANAWTRGAKSGRMAQPPVAVETNCATSAICCGSS